LSPHKDDKPEVLFEIKDKKIEEYSKATMINNPETEYLKEYLISNLVKLCKYDKGTILQLFNPNNEI